MLKKTADILITSVLWFYYIIGFVIFFSPWYIISCFLPRREERFQYLTAKFYQSFFKLVRLLCPGYTWKIEPEIKQIKNSIIFCNHISYLDPILIISLFVRQKTIVKSSFFRVPVFAFIIRNLGYMPAESRDKLGLLMIKQLDKIGKYFKEGGILFIFPEGTRSRDGKMARINRGALKIARLCRKDVYLIKIEGTEQLFPPGRFSFNSTGEGEVKMIIARHIKADDPIIKSSEKMEQAITEALK